MKSEEGEMMAPSMAIVTGHYWRGSDGWWPLTSMMMCSYWWSQDSRDDGFG
jgi:hypothetical protein